MMQRASTFLTLTLGVLFGLFFQGAIISDVAAKDDESDLFKDLKVFTDVLAIVQRDYVRQAGSRQLVEGAIKGMLATLDPHSGYLDPDFYQDLQVQTRGEFGGLGIEITIRDGMLMVVAPMEGSPAEKAGIKAGDSIVKIEGKFTKEFSLVDAIKKLRGPKGTPINISVFRKGVPDLIDVTLIRDKILVRSVRSRYLENGFGYIRLSQFMETSADDIKKSLDRLTDRSPGRKLRGLILDLRNNPGGLLTQAIMISDLFLKEGIIVYTDGRDEGQRQKFYAHARGTQPDYPIIVLVNGGSASAAEIVAGALKDHGRAMILGSQTFGKGSVQTITPLENGGAVTLTTALYYTKSGNSIQVQGVKPDIEVLEEDPPPPSAAANRVPLRLREGDLPGAIENPSGIKSEPAQPKSNEEADASPLSDGERPVNPETEDLGRWLERDRVMKRAYELLNSFNIFHAGNPAPQKAAQLEVSQLVG